MNQSFNISDLRDFALRERIITLSAIRDLVTRAQTKGTDIDEVAIQIKRALEVEMDQAAERQILKWFLR